MENWLDDVEPVGPSVGPRPRFVVDEAMISVLNYDMKYRRRLARRPLA